MFRKLFLYLAILSGSVCFFLIFVLIFLNGTEVACTQKTDRTYTCSIQTLLFGKYPTFKHEVNQVVDVEMVDDGCFDGCSYRTEFILVDGSTTALTEVYTDQSPVRKQTSEIKLLLQSGKPSFEYAKEPLWWVLFLLGGLFLMEFIILTFTMGASAVREYLVNRSKT